jgi:hypothetical protein
MKMYLRTKKNTCYIEAREVMLEGSTLIINKNLIFDKKTVDFVAYEPAGIVYEFIDKDLHDYFSSGHWIEIERNDKVVKYEKI